MAISMLKIRRPLGRLIFNMGIAIPGKTVFLIETAPRWFYFALNATEMIHYSIADILITSISRHTHKTASTHMCIRVVVMTNIMLPKGAQWPVIHGPLGTEVTGIVDALQIYIYLCWRYVETLWGNSASNILNNEVFTYTLRLSLVMFSTRDERVVWKKSEVIKIYVRFLSYKV